MVPGVEFPELRYSRSELWARAVGEGALVGIGRDVYMVWGPKTEPDSL